MRKIVEFIIISVIIIFGLLLEQNRANAETTDNTITIPKGQYFSKPISFQSGDSLTVSYKMVVLEGPQIDVYFFDSANFSHYKDNQQFFFIVGLTDEYTRFASNELTVTTHDDYYLVFDNTDKGATQPPNDNATAYVSYQITTIPPLPDEESSRNTNTPGFELMILIVAIAISLIILQKKYI